MSKTKKQTTASMDNIYTLDGKVPLLKSIPFGLQHVLAMFVANIAPIMIVTGESPVSAAFCRRAGMQLRTAGWFSS